MKIKNSIIVICICFANVLFADNITNKIGSIEKDISNVISWNERRQWSQNIISLKEAGELEQLNKILINLISEKNKNEDIIINAKLFLNYIKNKAINELNIDEINQLKENCIKAKQNIIELEAKIVEVQSAIDYVNYQ